MSSRAVGLYNNMLTERTHLRARGTGLLSVTLGDSQGEVPPLRLQGAAFRGRECHPGENSVSDSSQLGVH